MQIPFNVPNVACACGTLLFSWEDVVAHWRRHKDEGRHRDEFQKTFRSVLEAGRGR